MTRKRSLAAQRRIAFAQAYARCGVAEQAALEAGYAKATARKNAQRMLARDDVQEILTELRAVTAEKAGIDIQRVTDEFAIIAFADLAEFVEWGKAGVVLKESASLDAARRRGIVEVSQGAHGIKIKLADKTAALDRLGKHLGMFVDKVEHSGEVVSGAPVINLTVTRSDD